MKENRLIYPIKLMAKSFEVSRSGCCMRKRIGCIQRRKFKATTNSRHDLPTEPNLLAQCFSGHEPVPHPEARMYPPLRKGHLILFA
jgi:hypothetical protein